MTDLLVYRRDASWHHRPGVNSGAKYHRASTYDDALAACSTQIVLNETTVLRFDLVSALMLCSRCFPVSARENAEPDDATV